MAADPIDFWFTMGSTYSYLSVMRLGELERSSGVRFRWRPFHLLVILQEMKHVPFADKPAKSAKGSRPPGIAFYSASAARMLKKFQRDAAEGVGT
jgi:hypothetical protein